MPLVITTGALDIGAIMIEVAGLSFLGFGAQPPTPEWGLMLNEDASICKRALGLWHSLVCLSLL